MSNYLVSDTDLTSIADAIRTKGGTSSPLVYPTGFVSAIEAISGGGGSESESGTWTPSAATSREAIYFSKTHSSPPSVYVIEDATDHIQVASIDNEIVLAFYVDFYRLTGSGLYYSTTIPDSDKRYSSLRTIMRTKSNSFKFDDGITLFSSDDPGSASNSYSRYYCDESKIWATSYASNMNRFVPTRTYSWVALWI